MQGLKCDAQRVPGVRLIFAFHTRSVGRAMIQAALSNHGGVRSTLASGAGRDLRAQRRLASDRERQPGADRESHPDDRGGGRRHARRRLLTTALFDE